MKTKHSVSIGTLLNALSEMISEADVLSAKLLADISLEISKERISRNMNQKNFAEFMDVTQSQVSKWESDSYNFTIEKLSEIACKLDLDLDIALRKKVTHLARTDNIIPFPKNTTSSRVTGVTPSQRWAVITEASQEQLKEN